MATYMGITASSLGALSEHYRVITSNLANASTSGFKRQHAQFTQVVQDPDPNDYEPGKALLVRESSIDFSPGMIVQTGRTLDVALHGPGFLQIETKNGPLFTRNGHMKVGPQGVLQTISGDVVSGDRGPITIPDSVSTMHLRISRDGTIDYEDRPLGKLKIVELETLSGLTAVGGSNFRAPETAVRRDAKRTTVVQGFQEASNVNIVDELVDLIKVSRLYEANMKTIQAQDALHAFVLAVAKQ